MAYSRFRPVCRGCQCYDTTGFDRLCTFGKRPRRFRRKDPTRYVPKWCPKLKAPPEVRVYSLTPQGFEYHWLFKPEHPMAHHYYLRYKGLAATTVAQYNKAARPRRDLSEWVGTYVQRNDVVVLDDGINPYAFYHGEKKTIMISYFDMTQTKEFDEHDPEIA